MTGSRRVSVAAVLALSLLLPTMVVAEVTRVDITSRRDVAGGRSFGSAGPYELIVARLYFAVDPNQARNKIVTDLDKAPRNAAGQVEFSADLAILKPKDQSHGSGVALIDIVNRGNKTVLTSFNRAAPSRDLSTDAELGDGFLLHQGHTLVWVGWEFDVPARSGGLRIEVPVAKGVTGTVHASFIPESREEEIAVRDLSGYLPASPEAAENTLTVREGLQGAVSTIPRHKWRVSGTTVTLEGGFEPGKIYEISYGGANPPVSGLGFVAVRDTASWIRYTTDAAASAKYAYAFGSSQSGRFLRDFLYQGFNTDEGNRQVFDAVMANIAGASRIDLNNRWATPISLGSNAATSFPFADTKQRDPVTGADEGALDNVRARDHQPKIFYTNTGVEYWGGGRAAALIHTAPDGSRDLMVPDNERIYFLTGSQHGPSRFPSAVTNGQQRDNPNNYWWTMRALMVAMDKWVRDRVQPPASRYPRLQDGTLVRSADVAFPTLATVTSPRTLLPSQRGINRLVAQEGAPGSPLPLLVPQVDQDGNELAGIRLPDIVVPLATYTGWNFRKPAIGAPNELYPLLGSYVPFAGTKSERERVRDPRQSIEERYPTRERYLELVQDAGAALVKDHYLLANDLPGLVEHAGEHWDLLVNRPLGGTK
jgi:Alpha/beta hydrolase domain